MLTQTHFLKKVNFLTMLLSFFFLLTHSTAIASKANDLPQSVISYLGLELPPPTRYVEIGYRGPLKMTISQNGITTNKSSALGLIVFDRDLDLNRTQISLHGFWSISKERIIFDGISTNWSIKTNSSAVVILGKTKDGLNAEITIYRRQVAKSMAVTILLSDEKTNYSQFIVAPELELTSDLFRTIQEIITQNR